jgi:CHAP domain
MNCNGSSYDLTRRGRHHLAKLALLAIIMAMCTLLPGLGQRASAAIVSPNCQVLVSANQWLGGHGVDVCLNTYGNNGPSWQFGQKWQCVELAQRLYNNLNWTGKSIFPVNSAYQIYDVAPSLGFIRHANGDGIPKPGDMIIHAATTNNAAGHVSIVDYVAGSVVNVVEQNGNATGRGSYTLSGSMLSRPGFGEIRGYVHAPLNTITQTPTPPPPQFSGTVGEARRPDGTMDIFVRGLDGAPWHLWLDANGNILHNYESLGGQVQGAMSGSWTADGTHLDVFGVGADKAIYRDRYQSATGTFSGWTLVPGGGTAG